MEDKISRFEVKKFSPHLYLNPAYQRSGCGATALALLTGINPLTDVAWRDHWSDNFMRSFLRKRGFKTLKLTPELVTNFDYVTSPVGNRYVILLSQHYNKKECSWAVICNGLYYHNFAVYEFKPLELINHPIKTIYLVWHKDWS